MKTKTILAIIVCFALLPGLAIAVPPDIYEHGFEDGTSGQFHNGIGQPFIINSAWTLDTSDAMLGSNSVSQLYPALCGGGCACNTLCSNTGDAFFYDFSSNRKSVYVRTAYKHDPGADLTNPWKGIRFKGNSAAGEAPSGGFMGTFLFNNYQWFWDGYWTPGSGGGGPNTANPAPNPNLERGTWHWFEIYWDISDPNSITALIWIDGVLTHNYTKNYPHNTNHEIYQVQFDGTVNGLTVPSTGKFDEVALSSQPIGIPQQFATPDIYEWSFEGGDDVTASGAFTNGGPAPFISSTAFVRDSDSVTGSQSVSQLYPNICGGGFACQCGTGCANVGDPGFFYDIPTNHQELYVRFWHKQDANADNSYPWKMLRFTETVGGNRWGNMILNIGGQNTYGMFFTVFDPFTNYLPNVVAENPNANRGQWKCIEMYLDTRTTNVNALLWLDEVLISNHTVSDPGGPRNIGALQFDGTVNAVLQDSTAWFDDIAVSTQRIGCGNVSQAPPPDTTPAVITTVLPNQQNFPSGTSQVNLQLSTNENARCKYSTTANTPYQNMIFTITGGLTQTHSTTLSGLSDGNTYNYYIRCEDAAGNRNTVDHTVTFSILNPLCVDGQQRQCGVSNIGACTLGVETCQSGVWINCNAVLPSAEICDSVDNNCDGQIDEGSACFVLNAVQQPNALAVDVNTTCPVGSTWCQIRRTDTFTLIVEGSGLFQSGVDNNVVAGTTVPYEARAFDSGGNVTTTNTVNVNIVAPSADVTPPIISNGQPSTAQNSGTTQVTLSVDTDEVATCRFSIAKNVPFNNMQLFTTTGATTHSHTLNNLADGLTYNAYVKCMDGSGNVNSQDYRVSFSVSNGSAPQAGDLNFDDKVDLFDVAIIVNEVGKTNGYQSGSDMNSDGEINIFDMVRLANNWGNRYSPDTDAPIVINTFPPGNLPNTVGNVQFGLRTDESAVCRYSTTPGTAFGSMIPFGLTGGIDHRDPVATSPDTAYSFYVKCSDTAGNINVNDTNISFSVGTITPPQAPICEAIGGGTCYYVDPVSGNDANPGTFSQPVLKPAVVLQQAGPGDVVYLRGGTYTNAIHGHPYTGDCTTGNCITRVIRIDTMRNFAWRDLSGVWQNYGMQDGTVANPITLKSYPGETAKIEGQSVELRQVHDWNIEDLEVHRGAIIINADFGGVSGPQTYNIRVTGNHVHNLTAFGGSNIGLIKVDNTIGINAQSPGPDNIYIANNLLHDITAMTGCGANPTCSWDTTTDDEHYGAITTMSCEGYGCPLNTGHGRIEVVNNTAYNIPTFYFGKNPARGPVIFRGNVAYNFQKIGLMAPANILFENNLFYNPSHQGNGRFGGFGGGNLSHSITLTGRNISFIGNTLVGFYHGVDFIVNSSDHTFTNNVIFGLPELKNGGSSGAAYRVTPWFVPQCAQDGTVCTEGPVEANSGFHVGNNFDNNCFIVPNAGFRLINRGYVTDPFNLNSQARQVYNLTDGQNTFGFDLNSQVIVETDQNNVFDDPANGYYILIGSAATQCAGMGYGNQVVTNNVLNIPLVVHRSDGGSGSTLVSNGIPLRESDLMPADIGDVRLFVNNVEKQIYVEALDGTWPDGSVKFLLVQFNEVVNDGADITNARLEIGNARQTVDLTRTEPKSVPSALALPTDANFLVDTQLGGLVDTKTKAYVAANMPAFVSQFDTAWEAKALEIVATGDPTVDHFSSGAYDRPYGFVSMWARGGDITLVDYAIKVADEHRKYLAAASLAGTVNCVSGTEWVSLGHIYNPTSIIIGYWLTGNDNGSVDSFRYGVAATADGANLIFSEQNPNNNREGRPQSKHLMALSFAHAVGETQVLDSCGNNQDVNLLGEIDNIFDDWEIYQDKTGSAVGRFTYPAATSNPGCGLSPNPNGQSNFMEGLRMDAIGKYRRLVSTASSNYEKSMQLLIKQRQFMDTEWIPAHNNWHYWSAPNWPYGDCGTLDGTNGATSHALNPIIASMYAIEYYTHGGAAVKQRALDAMQEAWIDRGWDVPGNQASWVTKPHMQVGFTWHSLIGYLENGGCTSGAVQNCGVSTGACSYGTQTCINGEWGACTGGVNPVTETCDTVDNDCDGQADEDNVCPITNSLFASTMLTQNDVVNPIVGTGVIVGDVSSSFASGMGAGSFNTGEFTRIPQESSGTQNVELDRGTISFRYQPNYNHKDGARHVIYSIGNWISPGSMTLVKENTNNTMLYFWRPNGNGFKGQYITQNNYGWNAGDWVNITVAWDFTKSAEVNMYIDGVEPPAREEISGTYNMQAESNTAHVYIGARDNNGFAGQIADGIIANLTITDTFDKPR